MLNADQLYEVQQIAENNDGHCDRCHRKIAMYRYRVNKQMATILTKMHAVVKDQDDNSVNFDKLDIPYRLGTQRTKMRLHGLIAHVKNADGTNVGNTWLITKKGGDFLRGEAVQEKVVVFDNQVIGHEGNFVTIDQLIDGYVVDQSAISTPEAGVYSGVRSGYKQIIVDAERRNNWNNKFKKGARYRLVIDRLRMGQPVEVVEPHPHRFSDIAAFQKAWKIIERKV